MTTKICSLNRAIDKFDLLSTVLKSVLIEKTKIKKKGIGNPNFCLSTDYIKNRVYPVSHLSTVIPFIKTYVLMVATICQPTGA